MKRLITLIGACVLLCMVFSVSSASAQAENYIAIGDSLAAGQTPDQEIDAGYSDLIAMRLRTTGQLAFYTKQLAFPGFTTADVLERVQSKEARQFLADATLITISAGANDLLRLVQVNPSAGTLTYSQLQTDYALNVARKNMQAILAELKVRAPKADIYVMGYYFGYPYVHASQKIGTNAQLIKLNTILQQQAEKAGAKFVNVYEAFGLDATAYLPNNKDVHPNFEGYRQMANAFLQSYSDSRAMIITASQLPNPNPKSFAEMVAMQDEERVDNLDQQSVVRVTQVKKPSKLALIPSYKPILEKLKEGHTL